MTHTGHAIVGTTLSARASNSWPTASRAHAFLPGPSPGMESSAATTTRNRPTVSSANSDTVSPLVAATLAVAMNARIFSLTVSRLSDAATGA